MRKRGCSGLLVENEGGADSSVARRNNDYIIVVIVGWLEQFER